MRYKSGDGGDGGNGEEKRTRKRGEVLINQATLL